MGQKIWNISGQKKLFDNMKQFHGRHSETIRSNTQEFLETLAKRKYNLNFFIFSCLLWIWILPPLATNHRNTNPIRNSLRSLSTRENRYVLKTIGLNFPRQCFDLQRSMLHSTTYLLTRFGARACECELYSFTLSPWLILE